MKLRSSIGVLVADMPIRAKLALSTCFVMLAILLFLFIYYPKVYRNQALETYSEKGEAIGQMLALGIGQALLAGDYQALRETISWVDGNPDVLSIIIIEDGEVIA